MQMKAEIEIEGQGDKSMAAQRENKKLLKTTKSF